MAVSYNKLWKWMIDENRSITDLINMAGISTGVLAKLNRDQDVSVKYTLRSFAQHWTANLMILPKCH